MIAGYAVDTIACGLSQGLSGSRPTAAFGVVVVARHWFKNKYGRKFQFRRTDDGQTEMILKLERGPPQASKSCTVLGRFTTTW